MLNYELLNTDNIREYLISRIALQGLLDFENIIKIEEIGDGNMNLVFRAVDGTGKSIILKQALPWVRLSKGEWSMTPERVRSEANILTVHGKIIPELVVKVLDFDLSRYVLVLEDLHDYQVLRTLFNDSKIIPGVSRKVGQYCGATAFATSIFGLGRVEYANAVKEAMNPDLCAITEDLVFTEPYHDIGRNSYLEENIPDVRELEANLNLLREIGMAKYAFMTHAESYIHGDLHTGSVFVKTNDTVEPEVKIFDAEFAFYGPTAFDIGAYAGNLVLAAARAKALGEKDRVEWLLNEVGELWQGFEDAFVEYWPNRIDKRLWDDRFLAELLARWQREMWIFAAAKMTRRVIGWAKVTDIESLAPELRVLAVRGILQSAQRLVAHIDLGTSPSEFKEIVFNSLAMAFVDKE